MTDATELESALADIIVALRQRGERFALVRGLAVSVRGEVRVTQVLSMTERRLQDRLDAQRLLERAPALDLDQVRDNLRAIAERGYHRDQNLGSAPRWREVGLIAPSDKLPNYRIPVDT